MNTARWILAHQNIVNKERRELRKWTRFAGTDLAAYSDKVPDEYDPIRAIPLAAVLNPEAFHKLANTQMSSEESSIPDDEYQQQVDVLEKGGYLTEIDTLVQGAEEKLKEKKDEKRANFNPGEGDPEYLKKIDKMNEELAERAKYRKRPRIIR